MFLSQEWGTYHHHNITLSCNGVRSHKAGDVVMIQPQNTSDVVEEITALLQLDSAAVFTLKQTDKGYLCRYV